MDLSESTLFMTGNQRMLETKEGKDRFVLYSLHNMEKSSDVFQGLSTPFL